MQGTGLVPARFLTLIAHLVLVIVVFWTRDENVKMCLPEDYTSSDFNDKDIEMIVALSITLGLFAVEFIGFMGGITMFMPFQALLSTAAHSGAAIALAYFLFDQWPCHWYWYIFGFCSAFPACMEIIYIIGILCFRKGY
ncbi:transmembrane protein 107 [Biomphalaria pfeifferi]|uniref:Transmembrane protein 107 n=1 Tax=Biomphalaria pfeifferi TaxID=112525 RepID=A0AAD8BX01_BIOPF|nr:transmembrane protein 107 [Biomphalaria pfeifferi]